MTTHSSSSSTSPPPLNTGPQQQHQPQPQPQQHTERELLHAASHQQQQQQQQEYQQPTDSTALLHHSRSSTNYTDHDSAAEAEAPTSAQNNNTPDNAPNNDNKNTHCRYPPLPPSFSDKTTTGEEDHRLQPYWHSPIFSWTHKRFSTRGAMVIALFLCNTILYLNRANISVAVVSMFPKDATPNAAHKQGIVTSSFYWGYISSQIAGATLSGGKVGGKRVLLAAVLAWSTATLLAVPAFDISIMLLIATRVLVGIAEGVNFPAQGTLATKFFPITESARAWSVIITGEQTGTVLAMAICPWIISAWGWPWIFYSCGIVGLLWGAWFFFYAHETPEDHPTIALGEKHMIQKSRPAFSPPRKTPWLAFFSYPSIWALFTAHFCNNFGWYILLSWTPKYFKDQFDLEWKHLGFVAMAPYLAMAITAVFAGRVSDAVINKWHWPILRVRRIMNTVGSIGPAVCFVFLHSGLSKPHALTLMCLGLALNGFVRAGFWVSYLDQTQMFSGQLIGLSNSFATLPGIVGNILVGRILNGGHAKDWTLVFRLCALFYAIGGCAFLILSRDATDIDHVYGYGATQVSCQDDDETSVTVTQNGSATFKNFVGGKDENKGNLTRPSF